MRHSNFLFFGLAFLAVNLISPLAMACKLTPQGYSKVLIEASLAKFMETSPKDARVERVVISEAGLVHFHYKQDVKKLKASYRVTIGPDCSTETEKVDR